MQECLGIWLYSLKRNMKYLKTHKKVSNKQSGYIAEKWKKINLFIKIMII